MISSFWVELQAVDQLIIAYNVQNPIMAIIMPKKKTITMMQKLML